MRLLALDQSTKHTGYAAYDGSELVDYGVINVDESLSPFARMKEMRGEITALVSKKRPEFVVFEQVQYQQNQKVYSQLSQMQGVVMCVLFDAETPFYIVEPTKWKSYAKVHGKKRAEQKAHTVLLAKEKYGVIATEDEADAIFIGHWAINNFKEQIL